MHSSQPHSFTTADRYGILSRQRRLLEHLPRLFEQTRVERTVKFSGVYYHQERLVSVNFFKASARSSGEH